MIAMDNSFIDPLHCQKKMKIDNTHALQIIHKSQREHANDSSVNDILSFDAKLELYFSQILKLKIAAVTKCKLRELVLGNAKAAVIKCLKSLPADTSWNNATISL